MGFAVSGPNTSLSEPSGQNVILDTQKPLAKIDSTKDISFQQIDILFLHEPPNPDGATTFYIRTLIYQFAHGYKYAPSTWFMTSLDAFATAHGSEGDYIVGGGDTPTLSSAVFIALVDDEDNISFYIDKYYDARITDLGAPTVLGDTLSVRSYIFVNDLSGLDVPSQA